MQEQYKPSFLEPERKSAFRTGEINANNWQSLMHPEDSSAIAAMEKLPGFSAVTRAVLTGGFEKMIHGENIGYNLKIGPRQLPEYYNMLTEVCGTLGIAQIPELYLSLNPCPNAMTYGEEYISIVMTSGLLESFSPDEIKIVLAHECGHILFKHVRYSTLALFLKLGLNTALGRGLTVVTAGAAAAFEQAVYRWQRMSEYSADRVSAIYAGSAKRAAQVIIRLAGGPDAILKNVNYEAFCEQIKEFESICNADGINGWIHNATLWGKDHPYNASRAAEIIRFAGTAEFKTVAQRLGTYCCAECGAKMRTDGICENGHFN